MFFTIPNASKAALVYLVTALKQHNFHFIDCQQATANLMRFGATTISRANFMKRLDTALLQDTLQGSWKETLRI